jgi:hypothetical protein
MKIIQAFGITYYVIAICNFFGGKDGCIIFYSDDVMKLFVYGLFSNIYCVEIITCSLRCTSSLRTLLSFNNSLAMKTTSLSITNNSQKILYRWTYIVVINNALANVYRLHRQSHENHIIFTKKLQVKPFIGIIISQTGSVRISFI